MVGGCGIRCARNGVRSCVCIVLGCLDSRERRIGKIKRWVVRLVLGVAVCRLLRRGWCGAGLLEHGRSMVGFGNGGIDLVLRVRLHWRCSDGEWVGEIVGSSEC